MRFIKNIRLFLFFFLFLLIGVVLSSPFTIPLISNKAADYVLKQSSYRAISDRITYGLLTDKEKATATFHFIREHLFAPWEYGHSDVYPLYDITMGMGYCDQQANTFITLLRKQKIKANLVFLYKNDNASSTHAVAEVLIDGKWQVFDPYTGVLAPHDESGPPLSVEELHMLVNSGKTNRISDQNNIINQSMLEQYRGHARVFRNNFSYRGLLREVMSNAIKPAYYLLSPRFPHIYQDYYYSFIQKPKTIEARFMQAKQYYLFGRYEKSERLFEKLSEDALNDKHYSLILLWRAVNLIHNGSSEKAVQILNMLDSRMDTVAATRMFIRYYWGFSQLKKGEIEKSAQNLDRFYQKSVDYLLHHNKIAAVRMQKKLKHLHLELKRLQGFEEKEELLREEFHSHRKLMTQISTLVFAKNTFETNKLLESLRDSEEFNHFEAADTISQAIIKDIVGRVNSDTIGHYKKIASDQIAQHKF